MAEEAVKPIQNNRVDTCHINLKDFYEKNHLIHLFNFLSIAYLFATQLGLIIVHPNKTMTLQAVLVFILTLILILISIVQLNNKESPKDGKISGLLQEMRGLLNSKKIKCLFFLYLALVCVGDTVFQCDTEIRLYGEPQYYKDSSLDIPVIEFFSVSITVTLWIIFTVKILTEINEMALGLMVCLVLLPVIFIILVVQKLQEAFQFQPQSNKNIIVLKEESNRNQSVNQLRVSEIALVAPIVSVNRVVPVSQGPATSPLSRILNSDPRLAEERILIQDTLKTLRRQFTATSMKRNILFTSQPTGEMITVSHSPLEKTGAGDLEKNVKVNMTTSVRKVPNYPQLKTENLHLEINKEQIQCSNQKFMADLDQDLLSPKYLEEKQKSKDIIGICSICLTEFLEGEFTVHLQCNEAHVFHEECLQGWVTAHFTCPLCRDPIVNTPAILERIIEMNRMQANEIGMNEEEYQIAEILANQSLSQLRSNQPLANTVQVRSFNH